MALATISATLFGCVGCQAGIEYLQTYVKNSLNLITFTGFIFTTIYGLIFHAKFFTVPNRIPIRSYAKIVSIFFAVNMMNNLALKFAIYFPLFIIFKSGTLVTNMTMGYILRSYHYTLKQIIAVVVVTAGIVIFTLASYEPGAAQNIRSGIDSNSWFIPIPPFLVGIGLLTFSLILSAYLGLYQETFYQKHGKHNEEMMFYVHFLSIPAFALVGDEMMPAFYSACATPSFVVAGIDTILPSGWVYIFGICLFQFWCTKGVYQLSAVTSSLNVTMVLTLRKFFSLLISFFVFENAFNMFHTIGALFVFIGTFLFSQSYSRKI